VRLGALLHDIGKIGVPDNVLMKPGKLTDPEFQTYQAASGPRRAHSEVGAFLQPHIPIVELHHERPDGAATRKACAAMTSPSRRGSFTSQTRTTR